MRVKYFWSFCGGPFEYSLPPSALNIFARTLLPPCCCMFVASRFLLLQDALTKARHYVSILLLHRKPNLLSDPTIRTKFQTTDPVNETISAHEDHVLDVGSVVLCQCVCVCVCVLLRRVYTVVSLCEHYCVRYRLCRVPTPVCAGNTRHWWL